MSNHGYLVQIASIGDYPVERLRIFSEAWRWLESCNGVTYGLVWEGITYPEIRLSKNALNQLEKFPEDSRMLTIRTLSANGQYLSAIEYAKLAGYHNIVQLLQNRGWSICKADKFSGSKLVRRTRGTDYLSALNIE